MAVQGMGTEVAKGSPRRWAEGIEATLGKCDHSKIAGGKMPLGQMELAHLYHWLGNFSPGLRKNSKY